MKKPNNYWTKEKCITDAKKYKTRSEWSKNSGSGYMVSFKNGWLAECVKHMKSIRYPKGYWTKERCIADAKKYKTLSEWRRKSGSYIFATKTKMIGFCSKHMIKPHRFWTLKDCINEAQKYKNRSQWAKHSQYSYRLASKKNWLEECTKYMRKLSIHISFLIILFQIFTK